MKRTRIAPDLAKIPERFHALLRGGDVYDSSCSAAARVLYIDRDGGCFLKSGPKGSLAEEAQMTAYFHSKGLGAQVLAYEPGERDWLLTARVPGEDCTHADYLSQPERLCDLLAECLRMLHETDASDCPVQNRMQTCLETAAKHYEAGRFDGALTVGGAGFADARAAWETLQQGKGCLRSDVLLHGDYCLPNVLLDNWRFTGFIDVGSGGLGDRHADLFWGAWSLGFNLKTDRYTGRFLDAYGRDKADGEMLRVIAALEAFGG